MLGPTFISKMYENAFSRRFVPDVLRNPNCEIVHTPTHVMF